jgi:hypothetical protein
MVRCPSTCRDLVADRIGSVVSSHDQVARLREIADHDGDIAPIHTHRLHLAA